MLTHLSLFSGIGGLDIAAEMAGFRTVGQCEWAEYPTRVLERHWPNVPRWRDIRTLTGDDFYEQTGLRTVDVISGGFPCQPFSIAGKRRGTEDDRYLWPEMLRVISELRPSWIVGENVAGIVNMALDTVLADLESEGYAAGTLVLPACGVDAPHRRYRVAILAHAYGEGLQDFKRARKSKESESERHSQAANDISDSDNGRCLWREARTGAAQGNGSRRADNGNRAPEYGIWERWAAQPGLGGVADGLSRWLDAGMSAPGYWLQDPAESGRVPRLTNDAANRTNRLKCLGNAVVPQQFYPVFRAIADIEGGICEG